MEKNLSETIKKAKNLLKEIAYGSVPSQKYTTSATGEYSPQQAPASKPVVTKPVQKSATKIAPKVAPKKVINKPVNRADVLKKQGQIINKGKNIPASSGAANTAFNKMASQSSSVGQGQVEPEQPIAGTPVNFGTAFEKFFTTYKQKPATIEEARAQIEVILKKIYKVK